MIDFLLQNSLLPDWALRIAIRRMLRNRLSREKCSTEEAQRDKLNELINELRHSPIAINTSEANQQHYEVPAEFFRLVLGPWMKYSCGLWPEGVNTLEESEAKMLDLTISHAGIENGQRILDLGCGWGSFTLYAAQRYPDTSFTAVSNSVSQRVFVEHRVRELKLKNVKAITADINDFDPMEKFDRVVSVEMFEHVRNYELLFQRILSWLKDDGRLFVHIFNHRKFAYKFEVKNESDWMARHFFTGGMMPSGDLLFHFSNDFTTAGQWTINGNHYSKTLEAWLKNMDRNKNLIFPIFERVYGAEANRFWSYWRIFFMACSETFRLNGGAEWQVGHYLWRKKS